MIDNKASKVMTALKEGKARFTTLQRSVRNPRTLSSKLKYLTHLGLVKKEGGLYKLTEKGERALTHLEELSLMLHPSPPITVERIPHKAFRGYIRRFCEELLERYGKDLIGLLVFGSVARGDWDRDSDIDLLIVLREFGKSRSGVLSDMNDLRRELRESQEYKECVSVGQYPILEIYPVESGDAGRFRRMYLDALTEGIVVLEREGFLSELIKRFKERLKEIGARRIEIPTKGHYWILGDLEADSELTEEDISELDEKIKEGIFRHYAEKKKHEDGD
ncbi:MAG: nucleotidyltransferase domain-containing protein [Thermoplasmata archaeon]